MNNLEIVNVLDDLNDANAMLEVCRGYTQADEPDMKSLEVALWSTARIYESIYNRLSEAKGEQNGEQNG